MAKAIEVDAGEALPDLRQALKEAKGRVGGVTTPEQILVRQARQKSGLTQADFAECIDTPVAMLRDWEPVHIAGGCAETPATHREASSTVRRIGSRLRGDAGRFDGPLS